MTCRYCGTEIAAKALICFRCGKATSEPRIAPPAEESVFAHRKRSRWPVVVLAVVAALVAAALWALSQ
jgi:hypothetical protein